MDAMKINLVVASGVHQGKSIPVPGVKLVIGRDPQCHLRPASPAVSKVHCTIEVRENRVVVTDHGSTNGTFVNDEQIEGEVEVALGDRLRVGPLDFTVQLAPGSKTDTTPLPESLKAVDGPATSKLADAMGVKSPAVPKPAAGTPKPMPKAPATESKSAQAPAPKPNPKPKPKVTASADDPDNIAAMLLADDEDSGPQPSVPEGSTVMELPAVDAEKMKQSGEAGKRDGGRGMSAADSSNAASEILRKYMRRPK